MGPAGGAAEAGHGRDGPRRPGRPAHGGGEGRAGAGADDPARRAGPIDAAGHDGQGPWSRIDPSSVFVMVNLVAYPPGCCTWAANEFLPLTVPVALNEADSDLRSEKSTTTV